MKHFKKIVFLLLALVFIGLPTAHAGNKDSFDIINYDPNIDGIHYFTINSSKTLAAKQFTIGADADYSHNPLKQQSLTTGVVGSQTSNLLVMNLMWAYGINDWWNVGFNLPFVPLQTYTALGSSSGSADTKNWLGDFRLESKLRLVNLNEYNFGIAVIPFITFPTGESQVVQPNGAIVNNYLGNGFITGGNKLVLESRPIDPLVLAINAGYTFHKDVNPGGTSFNMDDVFTYGFGANTRLNNWLHFVTEVNGFTVVKSAFHSRYNSPIEAGAGVRVDVPGVTKGKLIASLGSNLGLDSGYGTPDWRIHMGVSYSVGGHDDDQEISDTQPEHALYAVLKGDKILISEPILFDEKNKVRPVSFAVLNDAVEILKENLHVKLLRIEGHMDPMKSEEESLQVSRHRANEVRDYLIIHGVDPDRLVAIGYGSTRPISDNDTEVGRSRNRRIEFSVVNRSSKKK